MKNALSLALIFLSLCITGCGLLPGSDDYPLAETGPYPVGIRRMILYEDPSRDGRQVYITLWYPAEIAAAQAASQPVADVSPDRSGAPYPLIISSTQVGFFFAQHMASYGFVVMGINGGSSSRTWGDWLVDLPLDILFALDQVAADPPAGMEELINTDQAGYMGYSFDGYNALALSGARVDPEDYLAQCSQPDATLPAWWVEYICTPAGDWDTFAAHAGPNLTTSDDGLWQPMTDARIRAVMPMAPEGAWLFGERGLQVVDRPVLIISATQDTINLYEEEACFIYNNLGSEEAIMISFIDQTHGMIDDPEMQMRMKHFAVAFFGYHLQANGEYADSFSRQFVDRHQGLDWGIH